MTEDHKALARGLTQGMTGQPTHRIKRRFLDSWKAGAYPGMTYREQQDVARLIGSVEGAQEEPQGEDTGRVRITTRA